MVLVGAMGLPTIKVKPHGTGRCHGPTIRVSPHGTGGCHEPNIEVNTHATGRCHGQRLNPMAPVCAMGLLVLYSPGDTKLRDS